jgi:lysophospholipase L1-like esterase
MDINVLLLGDSLTAGYHSNGQAFHPYSHAWPSRYRVTNLGVSGALVTKQSQIAGQLMGLGDQTFDVGVLMFGTNDLGYGIHPRPVWAAWNRTAKELLQVCKHLIACTVPDANGVVPGKSALNERIRTWAKLEPRVTLVDVATEMPFTPQLFDDDLHFNPRGYDCLGQMILQCIK